MTQSMTGFASKQFHFTDALVQLEIKSVNHRFCEVQINLPFLSMEIENFIKKQIEKRVQRGKIYFNLRGDFSSFGGEISYNQSVVDKYLLTLNELSLNDKVQSNFSSIEIMQLPGVLLEKQDESWHQTLLENCRAPMDDLISLFIKSREEEGLYLKKEIESYLEKISLQLKLVKSFCNEIKLELKDRLYSKISNLLETQDLDETRLHTEVAYLLEKADIEEEIVRLASHIKTSKRLLSSEIEVGKKINFICQEMNREINTMGSKSQKIEIVNAVIEMKSLLEKIREQILNIQ
ncbi:MAG: YicC family protein [Candidatus Cloacimonadota bacterium]|nr:MAG: YicC family protein [Candidatus Cloacimonadota bacterium]